MRLPLRAVAVPALAGILTLTLVVPPASASPESELGRPTHALAGPVAADTSDGSAPVSEDAHPVAPEVEVVSLDEAEIVDDTTPLGPEIEDGSTTLDGTTADDGATPDDGATADDGAAADEEPAADAEQGAVVDESGARATLAALATSDLAVVGISWAVGTAPDDLEIAWRTQAADGAWSDWADVHLEHHDSHGADDHEHGESGDGETPEGRDGTDPMIVTDVTAVEVSLVSATGTLPTDATLAVIDPGESTADAAVAADGAAGSGSTTGGAGDRLAGGHQEAAPASAPRPTIQSRAQWGADESIMTWTPSQGRVQGVTIHHTVNSNNYTSAQVPSIIRGIYAYHAQSWGRDWGDIGYNFLVDKYGRIWEGRSGGILGAPSGAHATGLNSNFAGISYIGNADVAQVPAAAFTAIAKVAAWKLEMHGSTSATGRVTVDAGTFNRVNGHRESKQTTCPGRYLYNRLPELRNRINSYIGSFGDRAVDRDLDGDGRPDLVVTHGGKVSLVPTFSRGNWYQAKLDTAWGRTVDAGDFDGDGHHDLLQIRGDGNMYLVPGDASNRIREDDVSWVAYVGRGSGLVVGGVDVNGDGRPDVMTRPAGSGTVYLHLNDGNGRLKPRTVVGSGLAAADKITLADDFINGRPALISLDRSAGAAKAYPITTSVKLGSPVSIYQSSWTSMRLITGVGDLDGDGYGDLVTVDTSKRVWFYPGLGTGRLTASTKVQLASGFEGLSELIGAGAPNGMWTFYSVGNPSGSLVLRRYHLTTVAYETLRPTGLSVASGDRVITPGDWNGDGRADLLVIRSGRLMLHAGTGGGRFKTDGVQVGSISWGGFSQVVGAGDWRGDGRPGLLAYEKAAGRIWFYPGDGTGRIGNRILVSNGAEGMDLLVNAGQLEPTGANDLLMRGEDSRRMYFYEGNGPGLALPPVMITTPWSGITSIVGMNDLNGDGVDDVVSVSSSGLVRVSLGTGAGTLSPWRVVGELPAGARAS